MRFVAAILVLAAAVGFGWVFSLPSMGECRASGRIVDPTERHCESADGYVQLQEHALFHTRDVVLAFLVLLGVGYGVYRWRRRFADTRRMPND